MVDMNDSGLRAQGSRSYEQLKVMDDLSYSESWTHALDAMNNSLLWLTWTTQGRGHKALDAMNSLGL